MTQPVLNRGDSVGFFQAAQQNPNIKSDLITSQIDPTQPQVTGLRQVTDPIIPFENSEAAVKNFDPDIYDLSPQSHLMRLIRALTGSAGVGGIRKQNFIARASTSISGALFVDLDSFYGALFNFRRDGSEAMPFNLDGSVVNPLTDVANSDVWDDVLSRDARFRSRIHQLARAINMGGSYAGMKAVAEAILSTEVDVVESWVKVDSQPSTSVILPTAKTYGQIAAQYVSYGNVNSSYNQLSGSQFGSGQTPAGNRGELIFTPRRVITRAESYQLMQVLQTLKPSNCQVTISDIINQTYSPIAARSLAADSENWNIQSRVTPNKDLIQPTEPLYQNAGPFSVARPVFSDYVGEAWSYNPNIVKATSYQLNTYDQVVRVDDDEFISYADGQSHEYKASDGVMDTHKAVATRLSGDGVVTTHPYSGNRVVYQGAV